VFEIAAPALRFAPVSLAPDAQELRGADAGLLEQPIEGVASFGLPIVLPLNEAYLARDADLTAFVASQLPAYRFALMHLAVTFRTDRGDIRARRAWASVHLRAPVDSPGTAPIVWSMEPTLLQLPRDTEWSIKLGAKLALVELEAERSTKEARLATFLQAFGLQESRATWEFTAANQGPLSGSHRLTLVARLPPEPCVGRVDLRVEVKLRRFVVLSANALFRAGEGTIAV
jgi:hypothetical protein